MPTAEDFRRELFQMMANAQKSGRESIEISARELYARVGPPRGRNDRMPNCCRVMKSQLATDNGDIIVNEPPSGQGPTLTIRYRLPRRKGAEFTLP
ncbi:MAG: HNH endonuclease [Acidobacteria bacterium]|nr:MAG: HNH endonuclease [Acidobacteriota bacterium]